MAPRIKSWRNGNSCQFLYHCVRTRPTQIKIHFLQCATETIQYINMKLSLRYIKWTMLNMFSSQISCKSRGFLSSVLDTLETQCKKPGKKNTKIIKIFLLKIYFDKNVLMSQKFFDNKMFCIYFTEPFYRNKKNSSNPFIIYGLFQTNCFLLNALFLKGLFT